MGYKNDRSYTNSIHDNLALPIIYSKLGWHILEVEAELAQIKDSDYAIDYHAVDSNNRNIVIQERFRREKSASKYTDFTLRYEREFNKEEIERKSEFFKMKAKIKRFNEPYYMVYGVVNSDKTQLLKYAIIDLRKFFGAYRNNTGIIRVDETVNNRNTSKIQNGILYAGIGHNIDNSSSFLSFDIILLSKISLDIIVCQEGYINANNNTKATNNVNDFKLASEAQKAQVISLALQNKFIVKNISFLTDEAAQVLIDFLQKRSIIEKDQFHSAIEKIQNVKSVICGIVGESECDTIVTYLGISPENSDQQTSNADIPHTEATVNLEDEIEELESLMPCIQHAEKQIQISLFE